MQLPATITGKVTAAKSGTAVAGICVTASSSTGNEVGFATSSAKGTYSITGLPPGNYPVSFTTGCGSGSSDYAPQWWDNSPTLAGATPVGVTAGNTTAGINAALLKGGTISGTVSAGTTKVSGVCVEIYDAGTTTYVNGATTSSKGAYSVHGLAAGSYDVDFLPTCGATGDYGPQWYKKATSQSTATAVNVTLGTTTSLINAKLLAGANVSGTVDNTSASPIAGIQVAVYPVGSNPATTFPTAVATTNSSGAYEATGLDAGSYDVEFNAGVCGVTNTNYETLWYANSTTQAGATAVKTKTGATTSDIDAELPAAGGDARPDC